ncbi:MAG TPA: hypothetical protein VHV81_14075 [Steroidobacteraceae bacterium]|jgi:hypothetical protein|nr:hypothetical protein [Steroidobacteraceae bacterium]
MATMTQQSRRWTASRYTTLLAVLAGHVLVIALMCLAPGRAPPSSAPFDTVELIQLPRPDLPTIKAPNNPKRQLRAALFVPPAPRIGESQPAPDEPASDRSSEGSGKGVDWAAEARRAVHAFDIRNDRLLAMDSPYGVPAFDNGWLYVRHRAGEQFKTANGDWIVWLDANCYQIADAAPSRGGGGAPRGRVYCVDPVNARTSSKE